MNTIEVAGKYNIAKCFSVDENIEIATYNQIKAICDNPIFEGCDIRMMPDMHPGKVGPIGLTIAMKKSTPIMPALIGNDIQCGMLCMKFKPKHKLTSSDFQKIDKIIGKRLTWMDTLIGIPEYINIERAKENFCTIGGGNHFIEIDQDENGDYYITIHTGSRSVGNDIYEYFMREGHKLLENVPYEDTYLTGELKEEYLYSMINAYNYAHSNRLNIALNIIDSMKWDDEDYIDNVHNYIGMIDNSYILHKGSIEAITGRPVIIPINMRDGIILGKGKGNKDWNYSAPHGAGRILKRTEVANNVTLNMYKKSMEGIYSSSINKDTLDESPFAYRNLESIKESISDTVEITHILKPVYNFKNGGKE